MSGTLYEHFGTRLEAELAVIAMHEHSKLTFHQKTDHLIDRFTELAKKERQSRCSLVPATGCCAVASRRAQRSSLRGTELEQRCSRTVRVAPSTHRYG